MRTLGQYMLGSSATFGYGLIIEALGALFADASKLLHGNRNNHTNRKLAHRYRGFPQITNTTRTTSDHARGPNAEEEDGVVKLTEEEYVIGVGKTERRGSCECSKSVGDGYIHERSACSTALAAWTGMAVTNTGKWSSFGSMVYRGFPKRFFALEADAMH